MDSVSYFSPVLEPKKTAAVFAALTKAFDTGGPTLGTAAGHRWLLRNSSSPRAKGKSLRLLSSTAAT